MLCNCRVSPDTIDNFRSISGKWNPYNQLERCIHHHTCLGIYLLFLGEVFGKMEQHFWYHKYHSRKVQCCNFNMELYKACILLMPCYRKYRMDTLLCSEHHPGRETHQTYCMKGIHTNCRNTLGSLDYSSCTFQLALMMEQSKFKVGNFPSMLHHKESSFR